VSLLLTEECDELDDRRKKFLHRYLCYYHLLSITGYHINAHAILHNIIGADINEAMLGSGDQVMPGKLPSQQNAAIVLPGSLFERINLPTVGAVFGVYESANLFPVAGADYNDTIVTEVGSQILSATVGNTSINLDDLREPVSVTLRLNINDSVSIHIPHMTHVLATCVTLCTDSILQ
jgi:hypothetical protein